MVFVYEGKTVKSIISNIGANNTPCELIRVDITCDHIRTTQVLTFWCPEIKDYVEYDLDDFVMQVESRFLRIISD